MTDTQAIVSLYRTALFYRYQTTNKEKVDYNAFRSVLESELVSGDEIANNCNALAYSLLAYSLASWVPDLGAEGSYPGQRNLLPSKYFVEPGFYASDKNPASPCLLKSDKRYQERRIKERIVKMLLGPLARYNIQTPPSAGFLMARERRY